MVNNSVDAQYFKLLEHLLSKGKYKKDRTGTGTISVFDYTMRFNMDEGFPLLTSKKMFTKGVIHELIWFIRGDTNIKYLVDNDVHIWDGDAYKKYSKTPIDSIIFSDRENNFKVDGVEFNSGYPNYVHYTQGEFIEKIKTDSKFAQKWGELGPVYGKQWRSWNRFEHKKTFGSSDHEVVRNPVDQIQNLINDLKNNPDSRRLMVSAWNVSEIDLMTLPPCHYGFQCYTEELTYEERVERWCLSHGKSIHFAQNMNEERLDRFEFPRRKLSLKVTIRSNDIFLGCPFNIASYSILLHLLSQDVNMIPCDLILSIGDAHLYTNHIEQAKLQLTRETFKLPTIEIRKKSIFDIEADDIKIVDYKSSPTIKAELSN
jgi:thymidylate synthase